MAQDLIYQVTLWDEDLSTDITPGGDAPLWPDGTQTGQIASIDIQEKLGEVHSAVFKLSKGAPIALKSTPVLTERTILKVQYANPATDYKLWRVKRIDMDVTGERGVEVHCEPLWNDLSNIIVRRTLTGGFTDLSLTLVGLTLNQALTEVISSTYGLPSTFNLGTVHANVSGESVVVEFAAKSFMTVIRSLTEQIALQSGRGCEFEFVWDNGNSRYDINFYDEIGWTSAERTADTPDPTLRKIHGPGTAGDNNRMRGKHERDARQFFNRVIPVSGDDDELITIGKAEFKGDSESPAGWINLESDVRIVHKDDQFIDLYIGNDDIGFAKITDSKADNSGKNAFTTDGTEANMVGEWLRFASNSSGDEIIYIDDRESVVTDGHGAVEKVVKFPDVPPYPNLLVRNGINASMDTGSGGTNSWLPTGWSKVGTPNTNQNTNTEFFRFGAGSLKVETNVNEEGVKCSFTWAADTDNPYVGMWVFLRSDGTNPVRIEFEDADGEVWPASEYAQSNSTELRGFYAEGFEPAAGTLTFKVIAANAGTTFYLDAMTVTRSATHWPYADRMGPAALFKEGVTELALNGGTLPPSISIEALDVTAVKSGTEIVLGSHVQYNDIFSDGGTAKIAVNSRVVQLDYTEGRFEGRLLKKVRLSNKRKDFSDRFRLVPGHVRWPKAPPVPRVVGEFENGFEGLPCLENPPLQFLYPMIQTTASQLIVKNLIEDVITGNPDGLINPNFTDWAWSVTDGLSNTGTTAEVILPDELFGPTSVSKFVVLWMGQMDAASDFTVARFGAGASGVYEIKILSTGVVRVAVTDKAAVSTVNVDSTLTLSTGDEVIGIMAIDINTGDIKNMIRLESGARETVTGVQSNALAGDLHDNYLLYNSTGTVRFIQGMGDVPMPTDVDLISWSQCLVNWVESEGGEFNDFDDAVIILTTSHVKIYDFHGNSITSWAHSLAPDAVGCRPCYVPTIDKYVIEDQGRYLYTQDEGGGSSTQRYDTGSATAFVDCVFWYAPEQRLYASVSNAAGTGLLDFGYFSNLTAGTWTWNSLYTADGVLDFSIKEGIQVHQSDNDLVVCVAGTPASVIATGTATCNAIAQQRKEQMALWQESDADIHGILVAGSGWYGPSVRIVDGTNFTNVGPKSIVVDEQNGYLFFAGQLTTGQHLYRLTIDSILLTELDDSDGSFLDFGDMGNNFRGIALMSRGLSAPAAPTNFTATAASGSQINLSWTDVSNETGYVWQQSSDGGATWGADNDVAANGTSDSATGLTTLTTYHFRLRAYNDEGSSVWVYANATTLDATKTIFVDTGDEIKEINYATGATINTWTTTDTQDTDLRCKPAFIPDEGASGIIVFGRSTKLYKLDRATGTETEVDDWGNDPEARPLQYTCLQYHSGLDYLLATVKVSNDWEYAECPYYTTFSGSSWTSSGDWFGPTGVEDFGYDPDQTVLPASLPAGSKPLYWSVGYISASHADNYRVRQGGSTEDEDDEIRGVAIDFTSATHRLFLSHRSSVNVERFDTPDDNLDAGPDLSPLWNDHSLDGIGFMEYNGDDDTLLFFNVGDYASGAWIMEIDASAATEETTSDWVAINSTDLGYANSNNLAMVYAGAI